PMRRAPHERGKAGRNYRSLNGTSAPTAQDLADVIVDRAALHIRARVPGCTHFTLGELTALLADFRAEVVQLMSPAPEPALPKNWCAELLANVAAAPCQRVAGSLVEASQEAIDTLPADERELLLATLQDVISEFPSFVREHESADGRLPSEQERH